MAKITSYENEDLVSFILFNCASNANSPAKICVEGSMQTHHWKLLVHLGRIWENRNREIGKVTYELGFFMVDCQGGIM